MDGGYEESRYELGDDSGGLKLEDLSLVKISCCTLLLRKVVGLLSLSMSSLASVASLLLISKSSLISLTFQTVREDTPEVGPHIIASL